jgi:elongation factor Ts
VGVPLKDDDIMAAITAEAVKKLRDRTGIQMMKCKAALVEASGDMDKAVEILRKQNKEAQVKFAEREAAEGRIGIYIDPVQKIGGIVEVRCESAPVAKSEMFVKLATDLAKQAAVQGATTPEAMLAQKFVDNPAQTVNERIGEVVGLIRENMKPARAAKLTGLLGSYIHHDGGTGVLLQVEGKDTADPQLLRDVAMHVTAVRPQYSRREDVPAERIAKEKEIAVAQIAADPKNANKPPQIMEKIAEGKLKTWYAENVLTDQPFVKDDSKSVGDLLKAAGLKVVRFVRYKVGELS